MLESDKDVKKEREKQGQKIREETEQCSVLHVNYEEKNLEQFNGGLSMISINISEIKESRALGAMVMIR